MSLPSLIRFKTPDEFKTRPAWRRKIITTGLTLSRIVGDYAFSKKDEQQCGLDGCNQPHQHGYVIAFDSELETHIGRDCGTKRFNLNWDEVHAAYSRILEDQNRKEWLDSMLAQRDSMEAKARTLLEALEDINKTLRLEVLDRIERDPYVREAFLKLLRDHGAIRQEVVTDADLAEALELKERDKIRFVSIGTVNGIDIFIADPKTRPRNSNIALKTERMAGKIRGTVLPEIGALSATSLRNLNQRQRKDRALNVSEAQGALEEAEALLETARQFVLPVNLRKLGKLQVRARQQRTDRILNHFETLPD
jgi:hypothetical protein